MFTMLGRALRARVASIVGADTYNKMVGAFVAVVILFGLWLVMGVAYSSYQSAVRNAPPEARAAQQNLRGL